MSKTKEETNNRRSRLMDDQKEKKYFCSICGYEYDPEQGDPDGGIRAGTPFEELPDDWICPVCGAAKMMFEELN